MSHSMKPIRTICTLLTATLLAVGFNSHAAKNPDKASTISIEKQALEEFNALIGGWRGVGQIRRNSRRGAWIESAEWVWDFKGKKPAVQYVVTKGKQLKSARVTFDAKAKEYIVEAVRADGSKTTYRGKMADKKLVVTSKPDAKGYAHRLTVTRLNEKRTLVLFERRQNQAGQFFRVAGVGYTRKGTSLAVAGAGEPECVVTGGKGTTKVSYKGKTYYVCCSGCLQAFKDDPETIIAEYKAKLAKRKAKKGK